MEAEALSSDRKRKKADPPGLPFEQESFVFAGPAAQAAPA